MQVGQVQHFRRHDGGLPHALHVVVGIERFRALAGIRQAARAGALPRRHLQPINVLFAQLLTEIFGRLVVASSQNQLCGQVGEQRLRLVLAVGFAQLRHRLQAKHAAPAILAQLR